MVHSLKENRKIIISFIRNNPKTTYKEIRKMTGLHPERVFKNGLKEAFKLADVDLPRNFDFKTKEERRRIIVDFIKSNPGVGGHIIKKNTKINYTSVFTTIEEAYDLAGVEYLRKENTKLKKRLVKERKKEIVGLIREDPLISITELIKKTRTQPYKIFKNMKEIYNEAGIKDFTGGLKRRLKKQREIINFIRKNNIATQREINMACKTHVQSIFSNGIFEAYEKAGINFPFERLRLYGVGVKETRDSARDFEEKIAIKLSGYGKVNRVVKTKRGFADIIFERKGKKAIIEVKNYQKKHISISQVNQLNNYLTDFNCKLGFLVCYFKPKKDKFLIDGNEIFILEESEIDKLPRLMDP